MTDLVSHWETLVHVVIILHLPMFHSPAIFLSSFSHSYGHIAHLTLSKGTLAKVAIFIPQFINIFDLLLEPHEPHELREGD